MNIQMVTASTTLNQLQKKVDTIANNISNMNTIGYKRREATFEDALTQEIKNQPHARKEAGRATPYGLRMGHGALLTQTTMYEQGLIMQTGRELDFMIEGEHVWFKTTRNYSANPEEMEVTFTRDGSFHFAPDQNQAIRLVTSQGDTVLDRYGDPIILQGELERMEVKEDGTLDIYYRDSPDTPDPIELGLVRVHRPDLLEAIGDNRFRLPGGNIQTSADNGWLTDLGLADRGNVKVRQGAVEMSNVDMTKEMTELIATQRLMQLQARSISMADEMMGLANSIRG